MVSPNNPTGSFIKPHELEQPAALSTGSDFAIIADEVFPDYELAPGALTASGRLLDHREGLLFSLGGLSKSVGLPQVKLGWLAVAGEKQAVDVALAQMDLICDTYLSVSTPVQWAAAELLDRGTAIRRQIQTRIRSNYHRLSARVADTACRLLHAEGGWSAIVQVPSLQSEEELVADLLMGNGVLVHPGYFFDFPRESYLVVSLLTPEPFFDEGIDRLLKRFSAPAERRLESSGLGSPEA